MCINANNRILRFIFLLTIFSRSVTLGGGFEIKLRSGNNFKYTLANHIQKQVKWLGRITVKGFSGNFEVGGYSGSAKGYDAKINADFELNPEEYSIAGSTVTFKFKIPTLKGSARFETDIILDLSGAIDMVVYNVGVSVVATMTAGASCTLQWQRVNFYLSREYDYSLKDIEYCSFWCWPAYRLAVSTGSALVYQQMITDDSTLKKFGQERLRSALNESFKAGFNQAIKESNPCTALRAEG